MSSKAARGLDLRSPRDQVRFRNRISQEYSTTSIEAIRAEAASLSGSPPEALNRTRAICIIAADRIKKLGAKVSLAA